MTSNKIHLIIHSDHDIKRHIKVQKTRSPYDGDWVYWGKRLRKIPDKPLRVIKLLKLQQSKCDNCRLWFKSDDTIEIHHKDRNRRNNMIKNLSLLHGHCHDELDRFSWNEKDLVAYEERIMDLRKEEGILAQKLDEGKIEGKIEVAKNLLKADISIDIISQTTGLPQAEIKRLQEEIT